MNNSTNLQVRQHATGFGAVQGNKDDRFDAHVLADVLRTDRAPAAAADPRQPGHGHAAPSLPRP
ncbi:MAG TPA: hypothetical protein VGJ54_19065 [Streptosporangiaceae bacterium]